MAELEDDAEGEVEPTGPMEVARQLHLVRQQLKDEDPSDYDSLPDRERDDLLFVGGRIVQWTNVNALAHRDVLGRKIHEFTRLRQGNLAPWEELSAEDQQLGRDVADNIADWLSQQGAWQ